MMMMKSENPAAKTLARTDPMGYDNFISRMNQNAWNWGWRKPIFYDPSGLDSRNVASPRDLAISCLMHKDELSQFSTTPSPSV